MKYILPKPYLSASSIGTLLKCPKQFEFRYVNGIVIPPGAALITGTAMHKTCETYYRDAMTSTTRLTESQAAELAVVSLEEVLDSGEHTVTSTEVEEAKNTLQTIAKTYVQEIAHNINPIAVEEEVRYTSACGVELLAYLDLRRELPPSDEALKLLEETGVVDNEGLCDYKITSKKWSLGDLRNSLQFNLYSMITGIGHIEIHNMIKGSKGVKRLPQKPSVDGIVDIASNLRVLQHRFDGLQIDYFENLIESAARLITSGVFVPCDPTAWCCTPDWCGYWNLCRGKPQPRLYYSA